MDSLFDTEFRNKYVEGRIKDTNDNCRADDWTVALSQISYEDTKVQMRRLFLSKLRRVLFAIESVR